jgi:hypothetical protein
MGPEPTTPTRSHAVVPLTPASTTRSPQQLSPAPTLVESTPPPSPRTDKLAAAFAIHDYLVRQGYVVLSLYRILSFIAEKSGTVANG